MSLIDRKIQISTYYQLLDTKLKWTTNFISYGWQTFSSKKRYCRSFNVQCAPLAIEHQHHHHHLHWWNGVMMAAAVAATALSSSSLANI